MTKIKLNGKEIEVDGKHKWLKICPQQKPSLPHTCCPPGLTPAANYVVYTDQILAGQFSLFPIMLPGAEEYYNGPRESNGAATPDDPADFELVPARAGAVRPPPWSWALARTAAASGPPTARRQILSPRRVWGG